MDKQPMGTPAIRRNGTQPFGWLLEQMKRIMEQEATGGVSAQNPSPQQTADKSVQGAQQQNSQTQQAANPKGTSETGGELRDVMNTQNTSSGVQQPPSTTPPVFLIAPPQNVGGIFGSVISPPPMMTEMSGGAGNVSEGETAVSSAKKKKSDTASGGMFEDGSPMAAIMNAIQAIKGEKTS